jgi:hypothetical protein
MDTLILETKWKKLIEQGSGDYTSIRISADCIPDLFLGYDKDKNRCLILSLSKRHSADFPGETREYISIRYFDESKHIVISLSDTRFNDVFNSLILSVYHRIRGTDSSMAAVGELLKIYHEWSEFFVESFSQPLSFNEVMGIAGEIFILNVFITKRLPGEINELLSSWTGPYDRGHDFTFDVGDVEVKSKPLTTPQIRISSEFQLEASVGKELTLVVVSVVTEGEGTRTLAEFIMETRDLIIERLGRVNIFLKAIGRKGLTLVNATNYDQYRFKIKKTVSYNCNADGFPKLVSSNIPVETRDLKYNLVTDALNSYIIEQNDY